MSSRIDHLISQNNTKAIKELKDIFGLGAVEDIRDFALTIAVRYTRNDTHIQADDACSSRSATLSRTRPTPGKS